MSRIPVIHGPNLNLPENRETGYYRLLTLEEVASGIAMGFGPKGCRSAIPGAQDHPADDRTGGSEEELP